MPGAVVGGKVPFGMRRLQRLVFRLQLGFLDGQVQNQHRRDHDHRNNKEQRAIADVRQPLGFGRVIQHRRQTQVQDAAHGTHQVDDGVGAAAQRLGRDVGHQGDRRRTVGTHRNQQQPQHHDKQHQRTRRGVGGVAVVQQGDQVHQNGSGCRAAHDKRHTPPDLGAGPVRQRTEKRQQKQRQYVIRRHNGTGKGFVQLEGVGQNQGHNAVVHLPKGANRQKRKTHQNGAAVVQFHYNSPYLRGRIAPYWHHCIIN